MRERGTARYDVFLSYGHAVDRALAPVLQSELARYAAPWYRARALRVFRDDTDLAAEPELWGAIEGALAASSWFVLLASPAAAASPWVEREAAWWLEHRPPGRLLVVLTAGELPDALPPALRDRPEPRWVDLRGLHHDGATDRDATDRDATDRDATDRDDPRLRDAVVDVAATVRGIPKDALVGEHLRRRRRAMRLAGGAVAALSLLLVATLVATLVALDQRDSAGVAREDTRATLRATATGAMLAQVDRLRERDPRAALRYGVAAVHLRPDAPTRSDLVQTLASTTLRGSLAETTGPVATSAWSRDGRMLATAGTDGTVRRWDMTAAGGGRPFGAPLTGLRVLSLAFSPDGRTLATGSRGRSVQLWDVTAPTGPIALGPPLLGFDSQVESVAFSPDGRLLATSATVLREGAGPPTLWDVTDPARPVGLPALPRPFTPVSRVAFAAGGRTLVTNIASDRYLLWDLTDPRRPREAGTITTAPATVSEMAVSPDGRLVATTGNKFRSGQLWDVSDAARPRALGAPFGRAEPGDEFDPALGYGVAFSPDGRRLLTSGTDAAVTVWDVGDATAVRFAERFTGHTAPVRTLAVAPDGSRVASGGDDTDVLLWDLRGDERARPAPTPPGPGPTPATRAEAFWSPDGQGLVVGRAPGHTELWNVSDRTRPRVAGVVAASGPKALSPDGRLLVAADEQGRVAFWDVGDAARPRRVGELPDSVMADVPSPSQPVGTTRSEVERVLFTRRGDVVAVGADQLTRNTLGLSRSDYGVTLWSIADPARPRPLSEPIGGDGGNPLAIALAPGTATLAIGRDDGEIDLWDVRDPARVTRLTDPFSAGTGGVLDLRFALDERLLAATSLRDPVALWDATRPRAVGRVGPTIATDSYGAQTGVAADLRTAAVVPVGGRVRLWDLTDPARPHPLGPDFAAGGTGIGAPVFSPDGRAVVTDDGGPTPGEPTLWDLGGLQDLRVDPVGVACVRAGTLSPADWEAIAPGLPYEDVCAGR